MNDVPADQIRPLWLRVRCLALPQDGNAGVCPPNKCERVRASEAVRVDKSRFICLTRATSERTVAGTRWEASP